MKVILLKDVKNVGKKDAIVDVSVGYANNYLIANKLAVQYTETSLNVLKKQQEEARLLEEKKKQDAIENKGRLESLELKFYAKTGKDGQMFGAISTKQIAEKLEKEYKIIIDKRKFISDKSVDRLGYSFLEIELYKGVIAKIKICVYEEGSN